MTVNRVIKYSILCAMILVLFIFSCCKNNNYRVMEEYCYKINSIIKDIDFQTAKIKEGEIVLYGNNNVYIQQIPFNEYKKDKKIMTVRKDGDRVYFAINGTVDDEQGIVFINDDSNAVLDGVKSIERIGGNSYLYSTN